MKNKIIKMLLGVGLLALSGCDELSGKVDPEFSFNKNSDLYGTWEYVAYCPFTYGCIEEPFYLVLKEDSSYFINFLRDGVSRSRPYLNERSYVMMMSYPIEFDVIDENVFNLKANYINIRSKISYKSETLSGDVSFYPQKAAIDSIKIYSNKLGYDSLSYLVVSNLDSLKTLAFLDDSLNENYSEQYDETIFDSKEMSYKLFESKLKDDNETRILTFYTRACLDRLGQYAPGSCNVYEFIKRPDFDLDALQSITPDTISVSHLWSFFLKKFPEYHPKDSSGAAIKY